MKLENIDHPFAQYLARLRKIEIAKSNLIEKTIQGVLDAAAQS